MVFSVVYKWQVIVQPTGVELSRAAGGVPFGRRQSSVPVAPGRTSPRDAGLTRGGGDDGNEQIFAVPQKRRSALVGSWREFAPMFKAVTGICSV